MKSRKALINTGLLSFVLILSASGRPAHAGYGFCSEPSAPHLYASQPTKPFCASSRGCSQMDVDNYRRDVDHYIDELKSYLTDVDRFRGKAYDYAKCMADLD
ncbi:MAG: hypothetical protein V4475_21825 [Pseudomonadota bacterium]